MLYSQVIQRQSEIKKEIEKIQEELLSYPPGIVHCYKCKNYTKWYVQYPHKRIFIPYARRKTILSIAKGTYLQTKLKDLKKEQKAIQAYLSVRDTEEMEVDRLLAKSEFLEMIKEFVQYPKSSIKEWAEAPYERWNGYPEQLTHETIHGFCTRSKSESAIADALSKRQIPYRYEQELTLPDNHVYHPEFTIMHPRSGNLIYWEHLGKMDDWDYVQNNMQKLKIYSLHGIIPGINLIITSETKASPLSQATIEKVLDLYFGGAII